MPIYDFVCKCGAELKNELAKIDEEISCPECGETMVRQMGAPNIFTTIIPTYPGSQKHKAGHVHKFTNRPATKTQIGYGGSVSADHPTGSTRNKD